MTVILFAHESMGQELQRDSEGQFICVSHGVSWGGFMWRSLTGLALQLEWLKHLGTA